MKLLTHEQQESYENAKICYLCGKNFEGKYVKDKKITLRIIALVQILDIAYVI